MTLVGRPMMMRSASAALAIVFATGCAGSAHVPTRQAVARQVVAEVRARDDGLPRLPSRRADLQQGSFARQRAESNGAARSIPACGPGKQATPQHPIVCPR
jgi:hypothetical protein